MPVPTNPDLPTSWELPGIYFSLNFAGQGGGIGTLDKRLLVLGYRLATGTQPPDAPVRVNSVQDAWDYFGRGSDCARSIQAAIAQVGAGVIDLFACPLNEPAGGSAATHLITVAGTATASGSLDIYVCGYLASVPIASGDTANIVAAAINAELVKLADLPVTSGVATSTVTLTARHKGFQGNDLPVRVDQFGAPGLTFSPGTLVYSGTAVGVGSTTVTVSSTTISAAVANSDTATIIAAAIAAAINAGGYPVTASAATGTLTLFYRNGRYVHRIVGAMITSTGVTITPNVGVTPLNSGAERPSLTAALTTIAGQSAFSVWLSCFNEVTTLGTISTHIEVQGNGVNQKGQFVLAGQSQSLTTAGAIPAGTTPALTASPRYGLVWCPESPQQEYELAARCGAMVAFEDYAPRNYDGKPLKTDATVPLLLPHRAARPSASDKNSAIHTYYMTPLAVDEVAGKLVVVSGKTTSNNANLVLHDWGSIRHIDFMRADFSSVLSTTFAGTNLRRYGVPNTPNTVTVTNIRDASYVEAVRLDAIDLYDGAETFKAAFTAEIDSVVPTRVNCFIPLAVIRSLHQIAPTGAPV